MFMMLIDYVLKNDDSIPRLIIKAELLGTTLRCMVIEEYCPSYFHVLKGTHYILPIKARKDDKLDCVFNSRDPEVCKRCWHRKVLI